MANQRHHKDPAFTRAARAVRQTANANPLAICWRCHRTLAEHPPGPARKWSGGHTRDGVNGPPWLEVTKLPPNGVWIAPEVLACNIAAENDRRKRYQGSGYSWP